MFELQPQEQPTGGFWGSKWGKVGYLRESQARFLVRSSSVGQVVREKKGKAHGGGYKHVAVTRVERQ